MSLILCIDTSIERAFVCISRNGKLIESISNEIQREHASFLHPAIKQLIQKLKIDWKDIDALAVVAGPGSYTGLRVGMAAAKGICFALNKPLICINNLELMAADAYHQCSENQFEIDIFCPMIDARRMEVFTALYDDRLNQLHPPAAKLVDSNFFFNELHSKKICFIGNGSYKLKKIINNPNAHFLHSQSLEKTISALANEKFEISFFDDITHCLPIYVKEHQTFTLQNPQNIE